MPRPPKTLPHDEVFHRMVQAQALANANIPEDAELRGLIILALTERFRKFYPDEVNHVCGRIDSLAKIESIQDAINKDLEVFKSLKELAYSRASTLPHSSGNIQTQRQSLMDFLVTNQFPTKQDDGRRQRWLKQHWEQIMALVTKVPCFCRYQTDYDSFLQRSKHEAGRTARKLEPIPSTPATATDLILSSLHDSLDPESIRKYAKSPSS